MYWNCFLTNDLYSPFRWYLLEYFESMSEVNFPRNDIWGFNLSIRMRQFQSELSQIWFFEIGSTSCYSNCGKIEFWLAPHFHQSFHLMNQIFPNAKMRSRFMILCQPSLNGLLFIFPQPLLYKPPISFIPRHTKTPSLSSFWVLVKLSSFVISWSSWDSRYWVRLILPLLTFLFLHP